MISSGLADADVGQAKELRDLAGQILAGVRRVSRDLRPNVLDDLGLFPAIEVLFADLSGRANIVTSVQTSGELKRLDEEPEVVLYRIVQEALRNVEKHAGATEANVMAAFAEGRLELEVVDDDKGFSVPGPIEKLAQSGKLGLLGMLERAKLVGATLSIDSDPGAGTRIRVDIET